MANRAAQSSGKNSVWYVAVVVLAAVALTGCGASHDRRDAAPARRLTTAEQLKIAEREWTRVNHGQVGFGPCNPVDRSDVIGWSAVDPLAPGGQYFECLEVTSSEHGYFSIVAVTADGRFVSNP